MLVVARSASHHHIDQSDQQTSQQSQRVHLSLHQHAFFFTKGLRRPGCSFGWSSRSISRCTVLQDRNKGYAITPRHHRRTKLTITDEIKQSARTLAYDLMLQYDGNTTGMIPGILPGPPTEYKGDYYWWEGGAMMGTYIGMAISQSAAKKGAN